jgi:hypothetical protein
MEVGYFGIPGRIGGLTHLTVDKKPICGMRLHKDHRFEWCGPSDCLVPECERCKKKKAKLSSAILTQRG